uniref:Uncharacterized protein n=1 Tax=Anguilla anguilla TaxID=7936 RepID=A0A0E9P852_ANGAN
MYCTNSLFVRTPLSFPLSPPFLSTGNSHNPMHITRLMEASMKGANCSVCIAMNPGQRGRKRQRRVPN